MERLQIAMEKARANRLAQNGPAAVAATTPAALQQQSDAWGALPEMVLDPAALDRNRIVAHHTGATSSYYDILRTRLRDEMKRHNLKRIGITSTRPQAGKSTTLVNLTCAFGRMAQFRTMVFDFDMRRPTVHKLLGQKPKTDMGQVLRGEIPFEEHFVRLGTNVAFGLNAGTVRHSSELLQSDRTFDLLKAVEEVYQPDLMLFDMPPFLAADDTQGFLGFIDGVILVVEAGRTTRHQLDTVEQKLTELTRVVGVVLNKCAYPDETDAGAYGYDYY